MELSDSFCDSKLLPGRVVSDCLSQLNLVLKQVFQLSLVSLFKALTPHLVLPDNTFVNIAFSHFEISDGIDRHSRVM
jgi:hypothetical protein